MNSRISVKIGDIPFSTLLRGFMLLGELKMDQKGTFIVFPIENFYNNEIFRYFERSNVVK